MDATATEQVAAALNRELLALQRIEEAVLARGRSKGNGSAHNFQGLGPAEDDDLDPDAGPSEGRLRHLEAIRKRTQALLKAHYSSSQAALNAQTKQRQQLLEATARLLQQLSNPPSLSELDASQLDSDPRLQYDENLSPEMRAAAEKLHEHTVAALKSDHDWWRVYSPYLAQTVDIRTAHQGFPSASMGSGAASRRGGDDMVVPPLVPGTPGYRSLHLRRGLPPNFNLPLQPQVKELSLLEALSIPGAPAVSEALKNTPLFQLADRTKGGNDNDNDEDGDKKAGGGDAASQQAAAASSGNPLGLIAERDPTEDGFTMDPRLSTFADERVASDWWIAYACSAPPRATLPDSTSGNSNSSKEQLVAAPLTLQEAMKRLGVIDPWSQAAAVIDPVAASTDLKKVVSAAAGGEDTSSSGSTFKTAMSQLALGKALPSRPEAILPPELLASASAAAARATATAPEDEVTALLSMELSAAPAFDYYSSNGVPPLSAYGSSSSSSSSANSAEPGAPLSPSSSLRQAELQQQQQPAASAFTISTSGLVATPALAAPGESLSSRVKKAYDALRRTLPDVDMLLALPGSMAALRQDVSARRIQRTWRGRRLMTLAKGELEERKRQAKAQALGKLAAVQEAVVQFCRVMENAVGVDLGSDALAMNANATIAAGSRSSGPGSSSSLLRQHSGMLAVKAEASRSVTATVSQFLSDTLASVSRNAVHAAQDVINDKRPRNQLQQQQQQLPSTSSLLSVGGQGQGQGQGQQDMRASGFFGTSNAAGSGDFDTASGISGGGAASAENVLAFALSQRVVVPASAGLGGGGGAYLSYNQVKSGTLVQERRPSVVMMAAAAATTATTGPETSVPAALQQQPQPHTQQQPPLQPKRSKSSIFRQSGADSTADGGGGAAATNDAVLFPLAKAVLSYQPPVPVTEPAATIPPAASSSSSASLFSPGVVVVNNKHSSVGTAFPLATGEETDSNASSMVGLGVGNSVAGSLANSFASAASASAMASSASSSVSSAIPIRPLVVPAPTGSQPQQHDSPQQHVKQQLQTTPLPLQPQAAATPAGASSSANEPATGHPPPPTVKPLVLNLPGPAYRTTSNNGNAATAASGCASLPVPDSQGSSVSGLDSSMRSGYHPGPQPQPHPHLPPQPAPLVTNPSSSSEFPPTPTPQAALASTTSVGSAGSNFTFGNTFGNTFGSTMLGQELQFVAGSTMGGAGMETPQQQQHQHGGAASRYSK